MVYLYSMQHHEVVSRKHQPHWEYIALSLLLNLCEKKCKEKKGANHLHTKHVWRVLERPLENNNSGILTLIGTLPCCVKFQDTEALYCFSIFF